jgi:hypothetical protein
MWGAPSFATKRRAKVLLPAPVVPTTVTRRMGWWVA